MIAVALLLVLAVLAWPVGARHGGPGRHVAAPRAGSVSGAGEVDGLATAAGEDPGDEARGPERRPPVTDREVADAMVLLALALRSGRGLADALAQTAAVSSPGARDDLVRVTTALRWGRSMRQAWTYARPVWRRTAQAMAVADESGAASAAVLLEAAAAQREEDARRLEEAGQRAGVLLVLPLGLCFLPAFVATAVVPLVVVLLGQQLG